MLFQFIIDYKFNLIRLTTPTKPVTYSKIVVAATPPHSPPNHVVSLLPFYYVFCISIHCFLLRKSIITFFLIIKITQVLFCQRKKSIHIEKYCCNQIKIAFVNLKKWIHLLVAII